MVTASKGKSFQRNLLLSIGGVFLLFAVCFSVYQYRREKEYKIDILHSRLQMYNYEMAQTLGEDSLTSPRLFRDYVARHSMEGLRVSIIDRNGRVVLDSYDADVDSLDNHLQRTEIQRALHDGNGYDIQRACSFGDIATTSFFPAKPLGCYGDGGAVFTNNDQWAALIDSYRVHGKGSYKYDNVRIGLNSRLDTLQAAILQIKLKAFKEYELTDVNKAADYYTQLINGMTKFIKKNFCKLFR